MNGIYLFSCIAIHNKHNLVYQDINGKRDIGGDALDVPLNSYDYVIATPPCNYYSKANQNRDSSEYALNTRHLLPDILKKLLFQNENKPFLVENVLNESLIPHDFDYDCYVYKVGGHTYWSNVKLDHINDLPFVKADKKNDNTLSRQGGYNVYLVVELFIRTITLTKYHLFDNENDIWLPLGLKLDFQDL